mgnify:CR=1 FL=1
MPSLTFLAQRLARSLPNRGMSLSSAPWDLGLTVVELLCQRLCSDRFSS